MLRRMVPSVLILAGASVALAQNAGIDISVVTSPSPAGTFVVDVFVDMVASPPNAWTASGIRADAFLGATFRYSDGGDPNGPRLTNIEPTNVSGDRNVNFVSQPRGQTVNARFRAGGAALIAGGYLPPTPTAEATATVFNVAYFDEVPPGEETTDGYVARLAMDVPALLDGTLYLSTTGPIEPSDLLVMSGNAAAATNLNPTPLEVLLFDVFSTIPEPASLALLLLGGLMGLRRR